MLAADIERGRHRRAAIHQRLRAVLDALGAELPADGSTRALLTAVERALAAPDASRIWLLIAVLSGRLPDRPQVLSALRLARLSGVLAAVARQLPQHRPGWPAERGPWPAVRVVTEGVLVDLHHTADTTLATGIQRVARQCSLRWARDHDLTVVRWSARFDRLLPLSDVERERAFFGTPAPDRTDPAGVAVVPWRCTYLLPELMTEPVRARALEALVAYAECRTGMIGFDCVPVTSAETTADGMGGGFASMLSAAAGMDRIAAISQAAGDEYSGWRTMLGGAGLTGPDVRAVSLAVEADRASEAAVAAARDQLTVAGLPMVLVVGSHEPRKNHLAILHAMELLWRQGLAFSVVFVGGNAWRSERFTDRLGQLQAVGRPVETRSGLSDDVLWGAYAAAHLVLFPSLNEGFGLPVGEALGSGTPVVTSGYGSMREIAATGGALFVDPRDDDDIAAAVGRLLREPDLHAELSAQARARTPRSWDEYAAETWDYFVGAGPAEVGTGPAEVGAGA
ncbi:MAG TPA: glycosyltransferase family 1 protein [Mycobacteriales bacterium]|nr:glycosyltransferase family 1 protein [Mycobacteriales bacterium]